ncbi:MAG: hypothetical protein HFH31_00850, partial [Bacilli bacterium]|nr:hypothetical protein [Bacilli bacterium]
MKFKKIFIIAVLLLAVFLIYLTTMDKKVYFLALGDSLALGNSKENYPNHIRDFLDENNLLEEFRYEFIEDDLRITDLVRNIEDNKKVIVDGKNKTLKNSLIKADLVTISIGNEELFYKMKTEKEQDLYNYIDEMMEDMDKLLKLIREYCKEDILILGYGNSFSSNMDKYIKYANEKLEKLSKKYDITYISLEDFSKNKENIDKFGFTSFGHKNIANLLIPIIEKQTI